VRDVRDRDAVLVGQRVPGVRHRAVVGLQPRGVVLEEHRGEIPAGLAAEPLPPEILPLSGDCALWKTGPDSVLVRVGFERFGVASFDLKEGSLKPSTPFKLLDDIPIYGWADKLLLLGRLADLDGDQAVRDRLCALGTERMADEPAATALLAYLRREPTRAVIRSFGYEL